MVHVEKDNASIHSLGWWMYVCVCVGNVCVYLVKMRNQKTHLHTDYIHTHILYMVRRFTCDVRILSICVCMRRCM